MLLKVYQEYVSATKPHRSEAWADVSFPGQVAVPRDVGTCTRCPIETRISSSTSPWTCQLSIRWEYAEDGTRLDDIQERPYGLPITDPLQIEPVLRSAQTAVLTEPVPGCDLSLRKLAKDSTELRKPRLFSRNAVCLDISGKV